MTQTKRLKTQNLMLSFVKKFKRFLKNDKKDFKKNFKNSFQKGQNKPSSSFKPNAGQNPEKMCPKFLPRVHIVMNAKGLVTILLNVSIELFDLKERF